MSISNETFVEYRRQLEMGTLFLIDNPGIPLPDAKAPRKTWMDFTKKAITSHLDKHTYYYRKNRDPSSVLVVDVTRMRRHMRSLCKRAETPSIIQRRREQKRYTCDEALFYRGTNGLEASVLQKCGYDKSTFSETDLPGREDEEDDDVTDGSLEHSSSDAEASEFEDEDQDDSAMRSTDEDEHDNVLGDRMMVDHDDEDRPTQQAEVQSTNSPTRALDHAVELQDHARPIVRIRIPGVGAGAKANRLLSIDQCLPVPVKSSSSLVNDDAQTHAVVAGHSSQPRVDADDERIEGRTEPFSSFTDAEKRKRDALEHEPLAEPNSKLIRRSHSTSITPAEHPLLVPATHRTATTDAPMITTPPEDAAATTDLHVRSPIRLDISVLTKELERLKQDTSRAVDDVLSYIGRNLFHYPTALDPDPSQRLLSLYVRCWGENWEEVRLRLTRDYSFTAPQVAVSLVSAFLYSNVLDQEACLLDDLTRLCNIASQEISSEAICHFLQPRQCWSDLKTTAHAVHAAKAYALLAQDEAEVHALLTNDAEKLATSLWSIIVPHFRTLSSFARAYGESSGQSEEAWKAAFKPAITDVIRRSLHHRLRLRGTGCKYVYTWPDAGEEYDSRSMQTDGMPDGPDSRQKLLLAVFPGLDVTLPDGSDEMVHIRAVVKTQQSQAG